MNSLTQDPSAQAPDDEIVARYREASALDDMGPDASLRAAVLAQAQMQAWLHADHARQAEDIDAGAAIPGADRVTTGSGELDFAAGPLAPTHGAAAANDRHWARTAIAGFAVLGLAGLLALQLERGADDERDVALGRRATPVTAASSAAGHTQADTALPQSTTSVPGAQAPAGAQDAPAPEPRAPSQATVTHTSPDAPPTPATPTPASAVAEPQVSAKAPVDERAPRKRPDDAGTTGDKRTPAARPAAARIEAPAAAAKPEGGSNPAPDEQAERRRTAALKRAAKLAGAGDAGRSATTAHPAAEASAAAPPMGRQGAFTHAAPPPTVAENLTNRASNADLPAPQLAASPAPRRPPPSLTPDQRLLAAATSGQDAAARNALERGAAVNTADDAGRTALMLAARRGDAALVQILLDAGADRARTDRSGLTAADHARDSGHDALARRLQAAGGKP